MAGLLDFIYYGLAAALVHFDDPDPGTLGANSFAMALPIFFPAPVITATCPFNFMPVFLSFFHLLAKSIEQSGDMSTDGRFFR